MPFDLQSKYKPTGDQPQAIKRLEEGIGMGLKNQVLLGVTGSGKTFTMANMIQDLQMPALILSHNKTLAGQLYQEFRDFFPQNAVSYFVSYYDYYQPEAYIPTTDTYIEKEADINELIDKLRLQSTANILTRKDVIIVASVSCIYNIGSPTEYGKFMLELKKGAFIDWRQMAVRLTELLYQRSEFDFHRGTFRIRGNHMDISLPYEDYAVRIVEENARITELYYINNLTGERLSPDSHEQVMIYPAKLYLTDPVAFKNAEQQIRDDLAKEHTELKKRGKIVEAQRLLRKVNYDLEMLKEVGYVNGVENYSRYFDGRKPGDPPYSLLDYFKVAYGDNFLVFVDESHMSVPQVRGMFNGDHARKHTLIDFGFRLQSAYDNRTLKFDEFYKIPPHFVSVSATTDSWELDQSTQEAKLKGLEEYNGIVEQLIRPTGIIDPVIEVRPSTSEIPDLVAEIEKRVKKNEKILVTTLTKKTAEDLSEYLKEKEVRAAYLHSDIHTLERSDVLDNLRKNEFDVLIGFNLLREVLDLPEVTLGAILDADKEGFLRSRTSLIQTMGRAARNVQGEVILYADKITKSMKAAMEEIDRRRIYQTEYNKKHGITPETIYKPIREKIAEKAEEDLMVFDKMNRNFDLKGLDDIQTESMTPYDKKKMIKKLEKEMKTYAEGMNFEAAIALRDKIRELKASSS
ncbi:excinuclease ABC subunit UvrB [soil metagenome]